MVKIFIHGHVAYFNDELNQWLYLDNNENIDNVRPYIDCGECSMNDPILIVTNNIEE